MLDEEFDFDLLPELTGYEEVEERVVTTRAMLNQLKGRASESAAKLRTILIEGTSLTLFDEEELLKTSSHIYDPSGTGAHSIWDPSMSPSEYHQACTTCGNLGNNCEGHIGHICLRKMIYHPLTLMSGDLIKTLGSICMSCGEPLLDREDLSRLGLNRLSGLNRLRRIYETVVSSKMKCGRLNRLRNQLYQQRENQIIKAAHLTSVEETNFRNFLGKYRVESPGQGKWSTDLLNFFHQALTDVTRQLFSTVLQAYNQVNQEFKQGQESGNPEYGPCQVNYELKAAKSKQFKEVVYSKDGRLSTFPILYINTVLNSIKPETARLLGFTEITHPRQMICRIWPILAPCHRPSVNLNGEIKENTLSYLYRQVLHYNAMIPISTEDPPEARPESCVGQYTLCYQGVPSRSRRGDETIHAYTRMVDNIWAIITTPKSKIPGTSQMVKGLTEIAQGKHGTFREHIMSRRVDYAARTVLSPGPNLVFGKIGIPADYAKYLTKRVRVNRYNINSMQRLLDVGEITVIHRNNMRLPINLNPKLKEVHEGDYVERWLQDGDYVLGNRQPTLHKHGMMAYEVYRHDGKTILLHMSYTSPLNADFDGDEGNIHSLQMIEAEAEMKYLMNVKECVMNPKFNLPIMAAVYDTLTGAYLMTGPNRLIDEETWSQCVDLLVNKDGFLLLEDRLRYHHLPSSETKQGRNGRLLFSLLLPPDFYYNNGGVTIVNGLLLEGRITKKHIGTSHNSIVQVLWKQYGRDRTADFLTDAPRVISRWLNSYGFSIGFKDCIVDRDLREDRIRANIEAYHTFYRQTLSSQKYPTIDQLLNSADYQRLIVRVGYTTILSRTEMAFVEEHESRQWLSYLIPYSTARWRSSEQFEQQILDYNQRLSRELSQIAQSPQPQRKLMKGPIRLDYRRGLILISRLLPSQFSFESETLLIQEGLVIYGYLEFQDVPKLIGAILRFFQIDSTGEGREDFIRFAVNLNFLLVRWMGTGSTFEGKVESVVRRAITEARMQMQALGAYPNDPVGRKEYDKQVIGLLGNAASQTGQAVSDRHLGLENGYNITASAGSKGNALNIAQILCMLGQQMLNGERLKRTMTSNTRCLPHFLPDDPSLESQGYCVNNLLHGLSPTELFFHQQASREGTTDTAVKTSATGHIHHMLGKVLEDIKVAYDGSVRNHRDIIFQYVAFDDGTNRAEMQNITIPGTDIEVPCFIDFQAVAERINARYGFPRRI